MTIPQKAAPRQGARRFRRWVIIWSALLAVSHLVRVTRPSISRLDAEERQAALPAVRDGRTVAGHANIAFTFDCPARPVGDVVVLLHGSPGSRRDFEGIRPRLAEARCVLAPDLPGFGRSSRAVPDYSFAAHAEYVATLLDRLGARRVHVVGFSMGGGVALSLARTRPARVASLTLISAIGVQELELFGGYTRNHLVHGLQLAGLWLLFEATPHMGLLDGAMLNVPYARNFFDSDQRPLRDVLTRLDMPTLILHGRADPLVPYDAAIEHHRLVPQSELVTFDDGHFRIFMEPASLAAPVADFLARVDRGAARTRHQAEPARVAASATPFSPPARSLSGLTLAVTLMLAGAGLVAAAVMYRAVKRRAARRMA